jgi:NAD(P)-dependent dehydrogenase (short-subunit alcohol dehydrogenase family)
VTKTVLLTGATGKFGIVLCRYFILHGWSVAITSRDQTRLDQLVENLPEGAGTVHSIAIDLQKSCASDELVKKLADRGLSVTHLINNARSLSTLAVQADGTTQRHAFMGEFELDVVIPYELTMAFARSPNHKLCAVVNIGSQYGLVAPNPALYEGSLERSPVQYGVSKAALHHLTRELAVRLAPINIRVNCVAFGGLGGRVDESFMARYAELVPSRRMLVESEIPGPIAFLLDDASAAINGHVLVADGGWSVW